MLWDGPPSGLERPDELPTRLLDDVYEGFERVAWDDVRDVWILGRTSRGATIGMTSTGVVVCYSGSSAVFVSSSIGQFAETIRAVTACHPFYDATSFEDDEHMESLKRDLFDAVRRIDPPAAEDGWWNDLLWDILGGDFGVEAFGSDL